MRVFTSYGPADPRKHFCLQRKKLVKQSVELLIGDPDEGGHYFTVWAPRQTGKTWLMQRVKASLEKAYGEKFATGFISVQRLILEEDAPDELLLKKFPRLFELGFGKTFPRPDDWDEWADWFSKDRGLFDRPVILMIDEFDKLPSHLIDRVVTVFRELCLNRKYYRLHGVALIGVRAVLGVESEEGSPFNIQQSLHVPRFSEDEVRELFRQYQEESGQKVEPEVVSKIWESTAGQPGLVGWFGELLTRRFSPGTGAPITMKDWDTVYLHACHTQHNNTVQNIVIKAKKDCRAYAMKLFEKSDMVFSLDADWCNYMYMHGLITYELSEDKKAFLCRFSAPFIQFRLYHAFAEELKEQISDTILALEPLDTLEDVFEGSEPDIPALLARYKDYLSRLKQKGVNPWKDQPRRKTDFHFTEAAGHFHLYHWLQTALGTRCSVSPEFPTGNGRVDLHLTCGTKDGIIEVKSYSNAYEASKSVTQAADYALKTEHKAVTVAMFVPFADEEVLKQISIKKNVKGVDVTVVAIGQY